MKFLALAMLVLWPAAAQAQTADPAITAHVRKASEAERGAIVDAVIACKSAFATGASYARRGSERCDEAFSRWTLTYAGGVVASPKSSSWPLWVKLSEAKNAATLFALDQRLSASGGGEQMTRGLNALATIEMSMGR